MGWVFGWYKGFGEFGPKNLWLSEISRDHGKACEPFQVLFPRFWEISLNRSMFLYRPMVDPVMDSMDHP